MQIGVIQEALHRQPFQPFSLRLADGKQLLVPHPDYLAVSPRLVVVINFQDESTSLLEPLSIASIEYLGGAQPSNGWQGPS